MRRGSCSISCTSSSSERLSAGRPRALNEGLFHEKTSAALRPPRSSWSSPSVNLSWKKSLSSVSISFSWSHALTLRQVDQRLHQYNVALGIPATSILFCFHGVRGSPGAHIQQWPASHWDAGHWHESIWLKGLCLCYLFRLQDGPDDLIVAGAAAEVAGQPVADAGFVGVRLAVQETLGCHDEAGSADAAL